jgi:hypothetical protein
MYKKIFSLIVVLMFLFSGGLMAADQYFTRTNSDVEGEYTEEQIEVVIPGDNNSQVVIVSLDVTTPLLSATYTQLTFYDKEDELTLSRAIAAGTAGFPVAGHEGTGVNATINQGDNVVIQTAGGYCQYRRVINLVTTYGAEYIITLSTASNAALAAGTKIYEMESIGFIGASRANAYAPSLHLNSDMGLIAGTTDSPLLITLDSSAVTTGAAINSIFGVYK